VADTVADRLQIKVSATQYKPYISQFSMGAKVYCIH